MTDEPTTEAQMAAAAKESWEWVAAYMAAGFTREEAVAIYVAWQGRAVFPAPAPVSPELEELMAKTRLIADDTLAALVRDLEDGRE